MAVIVIVPPATWLLTTLDRVKNELGVTVTDDDIMLTDMIDRASSAIARQCNRVFGVQTVQETLPGTGGPLLGLTGAPLVEITSVLEDDAELASTDYSIADADVGAVYREDGWAASSGSRMWGVEAYASRYILPGNSWKLRYLVTYRAGYVLPQEQNPYDLPDPDAPQWLPGAVEQACLETVKDWYNFREDGALGGGPAQSISVGQLRVSYSSGGAASQQTSRTMLPPRILGYLRNYVRYT